MSRFKVVRTMKSTKAGALQCFATVQDKELGLEFRDLRLFDGANGAFIKFPARSYEHEGETKYMDYVTIIRDKEGEVEEGREYMAEMLAVVVEANENDDGKPAKKSPKPAYVGKAPAGRKEVASAGSTKSGRGPVGKKLNF